MKKTNFRFIIAVIFTVATLCALCACGGKSTVTIKDETVNICVNQTLDLDYETVGAKSNGVKWSSSDKYVASVENGKITGHATGQCEITAQLGDSVATVNVVVIYDKSYEPSIDFNESTVVVQLYDRVKLNPILNRLDSANTEYTSENDDILTVSKDGTVIPKKSGTVVVTAKNGNYSASVSVEVLADSEVPQISLQTDKVEILAGKKFSLSPTVLYGGKEIGNDFTFETLDSSIATVNQNGEITGIKEGKTAVCINGTFNGFVFESVIIDVEVKTDANIALSKTALDLSTYVISGSSLISSYTEVSAVYVDGKQVTNPTLAWESEDETVATVTNGTVTAVSSGSTKINVTYISGDKTVVNTIDVTVSVPFITLDYCELDVSAFSNEIVFDMPTEFDGSKLECVQIDGSEYAATYYGSQVKVSKSLIGDYYGLHTVKVICSNVSFETETLFITKVIRNYSDLASIKTSTNTLKGYFTLANDIVCDNTVELSLVNGWSNNSTTGFLGTFDGKGYGIYNLLVSSGGLFYCTGKAGVIKNVAFINMRGTGFAITSEMRGTISDVYLTSATKSNVSHLSDDAVIQNSFVVLGGESNSVIKTVFNSTCVIKNVYGLADKFIGYDAGNIATGGKLGASFDDLNGAFKNSFLQTNGFNTEYWTIANGYPVLKSYLEKSKSLQITNTVLNLSDDGTPTQITTNIEDSIYSYSLKVAITGVSISKTGELSSMRPATVTVVVKTPYGVSAEKTFVFETK